MVHWDKTRYNRKKEPILKTNIITHLITKINF